MIQVRIQKQGEDFLSMEVKGHAEYAKHGKDLVCAAVSGITFGLCNALDILVHVEAVVEDNLIRIAIDHPDGKTNLIMQVGAIQLQTIAESYHEFMNLIIMEESK